MPTIDEAKAKIGELQKELDELHKKVGDKFDDTHEQVDEKIKEVRTEAKQTIRSSRKKLKAYAKKYWKYPAIAVVILLALYGIRQYSHYVAEQKVKDNVNQLKNEWAEGNQGYFDNLAEIRHEQKQIKQTFDAKINEVKKANEISKKEWQNVAETSDTQAIASYFDNIVDSYTPSR